ncbi:MAG TPA: PrgI family protein [Candidatus Paceibacterota bacterium]
MQYQVPQFIETEDKVVGPFSLRQFAFVGAAALISGICYFILQTWLFAIVALVLLGGALALSFIKINGRPLIKVITSAFNFYWKPQLYIWKPDHPVVTQQQHKPAIVRELPPIATIASGNSLHKSWENLQTGTTEAKEVGKTSDRQFLEKKMAERYEIFQRLGGDRTAARRVDYR